MLGMQGSVQSGRVEQSANYDQISLVQTQSFCQTKKLVNIFLPNEKWTIKLI